MSTTSLTSLTGDFNSQMTLTRSRESVQDFKARPEQTQCCLHRQTNQITKCRIIWAGAVEIHLTASWAEKGKGGRMHTGERERDRKLKRLLYLLMLLTVSSFRRSRAEPLNLSDDSGLITALWSDPPGRDWELQAKHTHTRHTGTQICSLAHTNPEIHRHVAKLMHIAHVL